MFQLWKHANGKWYVLFGQRLKRRISTRETDRVKAERFLAQFIAGSQEPAINNPTVGEILTGYRDDHGKNLRGQSGLLYGIRALVDGLGQLKPEHLTPTVVKRYALNRGASNGTVLREIGILRAALAWAKRHNLIAVKPEIGNPVPTPKPRNRWLTKDEAGSLLDGCTEPHIRLFVTLGLMTLARTGAILEARWSQVDWARKVIDFGQGYGNKRRSAVPIDGEAFEALAAAHKLSCSDYIIEFRGKPVRSVKNGFAAACRRACLIDVTPHILRHSGASWLVMAGVPLAEVARMLGDSERMVENVYGKVAPGYLKRAVSALQLGRKA